MRAIHLGLTALLGAVLSAQSVHGQQVSIGVCVVERNGALREVESMYNPATGDTLIAGRRFSQVHPAGSAPYSSAASWYINNEAITLNGAQYVKYGLPRVLGTGELAAVNAAHQQVPLFMERGAGSQPEVLYVPVRPGCEFQPYQRDLQPVAVRDDDSTISLGDLVQGRLTPDDPTLDDDSRFDDYDYEARAGERVLISMSSPAFDTYLSVGRLTPTGFERIDSNDDGEGAGTDSRLLITFPQTATYVIRANSLSAGETGEYTLTITTADQAEPAASKVKGGSSVAQTISPGETVAGSLSPSDPRASDDSYYDDYVYQGRSGERLTITLTSSSFDAYLSFGRMSGGELERMESDDDGGGGTDARIEVSLRSSGEYVIRANSLNEGETGSYTLTVQSGK